MRGRIDNQGHGIAESEGRERRGEASSGPEMMGSG